MPCNSDYMNATDFEVNYSRVLCLLKEVKTGRPVNTESSEWQGYHKKAYNSGADKKELDAAVRQLCEQLTEISDVSGYSLELQMWWRDHQQADVKRRQREATESQERALAERGLQKLTREEVAALKKWILK